MLPGLRFTHPCCCSCASSGIWRSVSGQVLPDVSKDRRPSSWTARSLRWRHNDSSEPSRPAHSLTQLHIPEELDRHKKCCASRTCSRTQTSSWKAAVTGQLCCVQRCNSNWVGLRMEVNLWKLYVMCYMCYMSTANFLRFCVNDSAKNVYCVLNHVYCLSSS